MPPGVFLVGFADDVAMLAIGHTTTMIKKAANSALEKIDTWMTDHGQSLAPTKSETIMLLRKWAFVPSKLMIGGNNIAIKKSLRYLGVEKDSRIVS